MDVKCLQAHWFHTLIYREERVCLELIRRNCQLILFPMSYECSCIPTKCLNIEDCTFILDNERKLNIYRAIKAGSCSRDVKSEDHIEESVTMLEQLDEELALLDVLQHRYMDGRDNVKNVEGVFCLHLAVCMDRKEVVRSIHSLRNTFTAGLFCFTPKYSFSYIHFAVEIGMNDMAKFLLQDLKTLITLDSFYQKVTTLIIQRGNKEMCKIFISSLKDGPNKQFDMGIYVQLKELLELMNAKQKYDCLQLVVSAMKQLSFTPSEKVLAKTFYGDRHILTCLLNGDFLRSQLLLEMAVERDDVSMVQWIMGLYKIEKVDNSVLVQATLNNSPEILKCILQGSVTVGIHSNPAFLFKLLEMKSQSSDQSSTNGGYFVTDDNDLLDDYTALDWAIALDFQECITVLSEHEQPSNSDIYRFCHPLSAVNYVHSYQYDTSALVSMLLKNGFTVQQCMELWKKHPTSRSPLYFAVIQEDINVIDLLLSNGADLEIWNDVFRCPYEPKILERFLYYNANICTSKDTCVNQILKSKLLNISAHLELVLNTAHTIPEEDMDKIANFCIENGLTWFDKYHSPSRLLSLCRKSFRRHCGYRIRDIVGSLSIPSRIRKYLLLAEELRSLEILKKQLYH